MVKDSLTTPPRPSATPPPAEEGCAGTRTPSWFALKPHSQFGHIVTYRWESGSARNVTLMLLPLGSRIRSPLE